MQDFKVAVATCLKEHIEELTLEEITAEKSDLPG